MRRETVALAEAVRELGVELDPRPGNPDAVRLTRPRDAFPPALAKLRRALDDWDRAASSAREAGTPDPDRVAEVRLRMALDAVFRWMKGQGIDVSEPGAAVAAALREAPPPGEASRKSASPSPKPSYAPDSVKGRLKPKPLLTVAPEKWEVLTLAGLRQRALRGSMTLESLGAAAPR